MGAYDIDKFMRAVNMDAGRLRAYVADPAAFTAEWVAAGARGPGSEHRFGGILDEQEQRAFAERDYGALYGMGAHPYLLWSFAEAVWVPEISRPDLVERFRRAAAAHGYPDFAT
ncbi:hypothetical protein [Actinomadura verrucosospora]|uniref:Extradiol ring-cleavage dioxygenase LigAB LigA subunit domain-containing protein n=1 Tax=Actinomadura verrucosospora TaxID=46165 RepID=A0A7D3VWA0_ACTVE|nr:hypothetical protein [Actinomadura verrucosospora]QKG24258.1 hypothetical protein ACTIVE_5901 [Actinomadura verrucosospora]